MTLVLGDGPGGSSSGLHLTVGLSVTWEPISLLFKNDPDPRV